MISWRGIPRPVDDLYNMICIYDVCVYWPWTIRLRPYISSTAPAVGRPWHLWLTGPPTGSLSLSAAGSHAAAIRYWLSFDFQYCHRSETTAFDLQIETPNPYHVLEQIFTNIFPPLFVLNCLIQSPLPWNWSTVLKYFVMTSGTTWFNRKSWCPWVFSYVKCLLCHSVKFITLL